MCSSPFRPNENLARAVALAEAAADQNAQLVVLPELTTSGYELDGPKLRECAEPVGGPSLEAWSAVARRRGIWIVGGFCERDGDKLYNSVLLVGPEGLRGHYRKLHLFNKEKLIFAPGNKGLPVYKTDFGMIGICVCYDLRFVEVTRVLALRGADLIAVPTAWVAGFDRAKAPITGLIGQAAGAVVQANLNQVYMACASQSGFNGTTTFLGSSLVAGPFGEVLEGPMDDMEQGLRFATFDPSRARDSQVRSDLIKPREDRRSDVYSIQVDDTVL